MARAAFCSWSEPFHFIPLVLLEQQGSLRRRRHSERQRKRQGRGCSANHQVAIGVRRDRPPLEPRLPAALTVGPRDPPVRLLPEPAHLAIAEPARREPRQGMGIAGIAGVRRLGLGLGLGLG